MSRTFRILAGAVLAAVAGLALAVPAAASSPSVSFSGASPLGLPLLSCASSPDRSSVSITTDDTLNVENMTGHQAYVYINGSKTTHQVGPNQGVPITFPAGSWTVAMAPNCLLNLNDAGTVNVTVAEPAPAVAPEPTPTHTADPAPTHTSAPSKSSAPAQRNAGSTTSASAPTLKPTASLSAPAAGRVSGSTVSGSVSGGSGTSGHGAPGSGPAAGSGSAVGSGGAVGSGAAKRSGSGAVVARAAGQQVNIGAAQALPAADSVPATPNYLLAVIALISILGVGSATVRALASQRAARRSAY